MLKSVVVLLAAAIFPGAVFAQDNTWTTRASLPRTRSNHAAATSGGKLYIFAGHAAAASGPTWSHTMDCYDPATNAWTALPGVAPTLIYSAYSAVGWIDPAGVAVGGDLYQIGGTIMGLNGRNTQQFGDNTVLKYSIASNAWTRLASITGGMFSEAEAVAIGSKIYAMQAPTTLGIREYDIATNSWTPRATFPETNLSGFAMGVCGGKIVVAGGIDNDEPYDMTLLTRQYDPATNEWTTLAPMPRLTSWASTASSRGRMWVVGGSTESSPDYYETVTTTLEYNIAVNAWTERSVIPDGSYWGAGAVVDGTSGVRVYSTGGLTTTDARMAINLEYTPAPLPRPSDPTGLFMRDADGTPLAEGDWTASTSVILGAELLDPNTVPVRLEVEVVGASAAYTGVPTQLGTLAPQGPASLRVTGLAQGAWKWRARCYNGNEEYNAVGWIEFGTPAADFNVDTTAPGPAATLSPDFEAFVYEKNGGPVTFSWTKAVDNSPLPLTYDVEVYSDFELGRVEGTARVTGQELCEIFLWTGSLPRYWRVRATDFGGQAGPWSALREFRILYKDFIDHAAGDAKKFCGGSATGSYCPIVFALIAAFIGLFRRK